jgi:hypothetical protein
VIRRLILIGLLLAPATAHGENPRPPILLSVAPSRLTLLGSTRQVVEVTSSGAGPVTVDVTRAGFGLDLQGRPRAIALAARVPRIRVAASWLTVRPRTFELRPGETAPLVVAARVPRGAPAGDHAVLVLFTTRPRVAGDVAVRMRLGVVIQIRAPGRIVHRLVLGAVRSRRSGARSVVAIRVENRGNATEALRRGAVTLALRREGRLLARLRSAPRELLPHTSGIVELLYRGRVRGRLRAQLALATDYGRKLRRTVVLVL